MNNCQIKIRLRYSLWKTSFIWKYNIASMVKSVKGSIRLIKISMFLDNVFGTVTAVIIT